MVAQIGQQVKPDAGLLTGEGYRLEGGFWIGEVRRVHLPVVMRRY